MAGDEKCILIDVDENRPFTYRSGKFYICCEGARRVMIDIVGETLRADETCVKIPCNKNHEVIEISS